MDSAAADRRRVGWTFPVRLRALGARKQLAADDQRDGFRPYARPLFPAGPVRLGGSQLALSDLSGWNLYPHHQRQPRRAVLLSETHLLHGRRKLPAGVPLSRRARAHGVRGRVCGRARGLRPRGRGGASAAGIPSGRVPRVRRRSHSHRKQHDGADRDRPPDRRSAVSVPVPVGLCINLTCSILKQPPLFPQGRLLEKLFRGKG